MPKTSEPVSPKSKSQASAPAKKPAAKKAPPKPIVYPKLEHRFYLRTNEHGPITAQMMKDWLGWETEKEATDKIIAVSGAGAEVPPVQFGDKFALLDTDGNKVRCVKNLSNRRPHKDGYERLAQDILNRRWADSINTPPGTPEGLGRTINGEAIIIGRHGNAISVQHRAFALIIANQLWEKGGDHWKALWPEPPTIEGSVVFGVSEDSATVGTVDNTIPRTGDDVVYTSGLFAGYDGRSRQVMSKMLTNAINLMWRHTGAHANSFVPYRTNSEILGFVDRHPHLVEAVEFIYSLDNPSKAENAPAPGAVRRVIGPGYASAILYLMGCSATDGKRGRLGQVEAYFEADPMPNEGTSRKPILDWSRWDQAKEFWSRLTDPKDQEFGVLRTVRRPVAGAKREDPRPGFMFPEKGSGGEHAERLNTLCRAWDLFVRGVKLKHDALELEYRLDFEPAEGTYEAPDVDADKDGPSHIVADGPKELPTDEIVSIELVTNSLRLGGIDLGDPDYREKKPDVVGDGQLPDQAGALKPAKVPAPPKPPKAPKAPKPQLPPPAPTKTLQEELADLRAAHPGRVILFRGKVGYSAWGTKTADEDGAVVAKLLKLVPVDVQGLNMKRVIFPADAFVVAKNKLLEAGHLVAVVEAVLDEVTGQSTKKVTYFGGDETVPEPTQAPEPVEEEPQADDTEAVEDEIEDTEESVEEDA